MDYGSNLPDRAGNLPVVALGYAACAHRNQRRKYTGELYVSHCASVARTVAECGAAPEVIAAAMLHDVLEDTEVTAEELRTVFGDRVTALVLEVTDISCPSDGNRAARKAIDRAHLAKSSPDGATIKLADLIDNTASIVEHDKGFARLYLEEKGLVLEHLKHGNPELWARAYSVLQDAQLKLVQARLGGSRG
jgi:(p)ppGpp synthase/HD superfamily hydrolase